MKIEKNFFVLCENFILDTKQRPSLINIYEIVWGESFPVTHSLLKYVINLSVLDNKSRRELNLSVEITDPKGKSLAKVASTPISIMPDQKRQVVGALFDFHGISLPEPGTYTATLREGDKVVATNLLDVKKTLPPEL